MPPPHRLRVHSCILPTAEGAPKTWLLPLLPAILGVFLLRWTPPTRRLELWGIDDGIGTDEVVDVKKPVRVGGKDVVGETRLLLLRARVVGKWRFDEERTRIA